MSLIRRRIAAFGPLTTPATVIALRESPDSELPSTTQPQDAASTIAPFSTALNGVDQPGNMLFKEMLWWTLGILALIVLSIHLFDMAWTRLRHVSSMSAPANRQTYWKRSQWSWMPSLKKHLLYAPLWKKRHNREIKMLSNIVYMFYEDWTQENSYSLAAEIRGRSGTLSAVNMVPLIILAGRNNPLIGMLRVSFDTYNLLHRWMGRMVVIEAVIHTIAWAYVAISADGVSGENFRLVHDSFLASGLAGTIALVILLLLSFSPIRHAFYETFLNFHIILAFIVFAMTWVHCATAQLPGGLPQLPWMVAIFMLWAAERLARMFRLAYNNWSRKGGFTEAAIEAMPADATRVTMHLPRYVDVKPGTHAYIRFMGINPWENHPFSIAWVKHHPEEDASKETEPVRRGTTSISFIIGAHTGFTRQLYNKAEIGFPSTRIKAAMEGPYAGHHSLDSYGHAVLFAGASGITHQISYLKPLIEGFNEGTIATRRVTLVWIMRNTEALEWVRPWMDEILRMPRRKEILNMQLFITRPKNAKELVQSASTTVQMFPGRPNLATLLKKEVEEQIGAMCVTVCGPGALADDVRQAVRGVQDENSVVDFVEESFTW